MEASLAVLHYLENAGLPFAAAIQRPSQRRGNRDDRNFHLQLVVANRPTVVVAPGHYQFAKLKDQDSLGRDGLQRWRRRIVWSFNTMLKAEGLNVRYSHMTRAERGLSPRGLVPLASPTGQKQADAEGVKARQRSDQAAVLATSARALANVAERFNELVRRRLEARRKALRALHARLPNIQATIESLNDLRASRQAKTYHAIKELRQQIGPVALLVQNVRALSGRGTERRRAVQGILSDKFLLIQRDRSEVSSMGRSRLEIETARIQAIGQAATRASRRMLRARGQAVEELHDRLRGVETDRIAVANLKAKRIQCQDQVKQSLQLRINHLRATRLKLSVQNYRLKNTEDGRTRSLANQLEAQNGNVGRAQLLRPAAMGMVAPAGISALSEPTSPVRGPSHGAG
jgi:hypothetical protein